MSCIRITTWKFLGSLSAARCFIERLSLACLMFSGLIRSRRTLAKNSSSSGYLDVGGFHFLSFGTWGRWLGTAKLLVRVGLSFSNACRIASSVALFVFVSLVFWSLVFRFYLSYFVHYFLCGLFFSIFCALLILFFVIFLLTLLSAVSRDFVSYSLVVTFNYVITSTSILFKALFYSKVVNNWRRSQTETSLLNFLSFFTSEVIHPHIFLNSLRCVCCEVWIANRYLSFWRGAPLFALEFIYMKEGNMCDGLFNRVVA